MMPLAPDARERLHPNRASAYRQLWINFGLGLAGLAGAVVYWWYGSLLTSLQQLAVWGILLLALAVSARKGWIKLFGPVLFYDAVRNGRRSRYIALRCVYAIIILCVLYWTYTSFVRPRPILVGPGIRYRPNVRQADAAALAESFFYIFMRVQFLAIVVFTPAYVAGAVAEEKERKTMEFLLATDLHNREIVLSKLVSRLGGLALLVLTGLPVLSILQFMGGVDPNLVLAGFAVTGLSMASMASLSILVSVYAKKPRTAIVLSYLILLAYLGLAAWITTVPVTGATPPLTVAIALVFNAGNIFAVLATLKAEVNVGGDLAKIVPTLVRYYALFHIPLTIACTAWAVARVRVLALKQSRETASQTSDRARFGIRPPGFSIRPRVGRLPMIWKEVFVEPGLRLTWIGWLVFIVLFLLSLYVLGGANSLFFEELMGRQRLYRPPSPFDPFEFGRFFKPWVRVVGTTLASLMLLGVAARASSSLSGERDRGTLDGLLTSPLQSHDILFAKWLGSLLGVRWLWFWLGLIWGAGMLAGCLDPAAVMLSLVAWLVYASCFAGVGLWFSISCRTTLRATLYTLATLFGASFGHWILWLCLLPLCGPFQVNYLLGLQGSITPPAVLYWFSASPDEVRSNIDWDERTLLAGFGLMLWAVAACLIWSFSRARFRRLTSRMAYRRPEFRQATVVGGWGGEWGGGIRH
jgi:ABC-type transport system involved in multi-copper enzyme maturation permease subunit